MNEYDGNQSDNHVVLPAIKRFKDQLSKIPFYGGKSQANKVCVEEIFKDSWFY